MIPNLITFLQTISPELQILLLECVQALDMFGEQQDKVTEKCSGATKNEDSGFLLKTESVPCCAGKPMEKICTYFLLLLRCSYYHYEQHTNLVAQQLLSSLPGTYQTVGVKV